MKEYIERKSLQDEIRSLSMSITGLRCGKGVLGEYMKQYKESILRIVDEQPTADVIQVVRCKDCYLRNTEACPFCFWDCGELMGYTEDNDFCSYGKKRKEDV